MKRLDSDLLRTFLAVTEAGSVTGGAAKIYRSQSAVSIQVQQLEALFGKPVFERHGRGVALNELGETLAPIARQIVETLDRAMAELSDVALAGSLRIGIPDEHGKQALSKIIAEFARSHPKVDLTVHCALSTEFPSALASDDLDMALHEVETMEPGMELVYEERMVWVKARGHDLLSRDPMPVALFDRACWWRDVALQALERSGKEYRVVYSSESVTGVAAAIDAGIAIGILGQSSLTPSFEVLAGESVLPDLPTSKLVIQRRQGADPTIGDAMANAILRAIASS